MKQNLKEKREGIKKKEDDEEVKEQIQKDDVIIQDYLASGCRDKTIKIWEVKNARCIVTLKGHDNWITDLAFHPGGRYLLSTSDDKSLRVWDLGTGRCVKKLLGIHNHFVTTLAIKQKTIVTGSVDQTLKVWNCR